MKKLLAALVMSAAASLAGADTSPPAPAVIVEQVSETELKQAFRMVGRVEATAKVDLLARVSGFLEQRMFTEGTFIDANKPLFQIERAPYEIAHQQAEAELASAQAALKNADAELRRNRTLKQRGAVSQSQLDLKVAERDQARANVLKAEAGLRKAQLDLDYTLVRSPISGQIGKARYSNGNLVGPNSESLATVVQLDPIYVELSVSEKDMIQARREGINLDNPPVAPRLELSDGSDYEMDGQFDFVNPEVDTNTDTIRVRASFPNPKGILLPGQFVHVTIETKQPKIVVSVPQAAVQKDREGFFVLTVDRDNKVEIRRIKVGDQFNGRWQIQHGLLKGERIIIEGLQKARPGSVVKPVEG